MSMNFLDETDDWPEYQVVRDEIRRLENERLEIENALEKAESALRSDPDSTDLALEVNRLRENLKAAEKKLDETMIMYR